MWSPMANGEDPSKMFACRGADIFSDHHQIWAIVKLKLCKFPKPSQKRKHLDISKLKFHPNQNQFVLELRNQYSSLADSLEKMRKKRWLNGNI